MVSVKVKFRPSAIAGKEGSIVYQLICRRSCRQVHSGHRLLPCEWAASACRVRPSHAEPARRERVEAVGMAIECDLRLLRRIIVGFEADADGDFTADGIVEEYGRRAASLSIRSFAGSRIAYLRSCGRYRTAETYRSALLSFMRYRCGTDLRLDMLSSEILGDYEAWMRARGLVPNTTSFYMRILRALYNHAVDLGLIEQREPFRRIYTGIDKTVHRALPLQAIRRLRILDLSADRKADYARDMFLLSFYLRGMSFVDMAFLKKTDLSGGRVTYRRRKTGQLISVAWAKEMQTILDKYPRNPTPYLLPIITRPGASAIRSYRNRGYNINRNLKRLAGKAGVDMPLTLYCARHSWASLARASGIPVRVISEGMGHKSESTTQIYLASIDNSSVDRANAKVIRMLK